MLEIVIKDIHQTVSSWNYNMSNEYFCENLTILANAYRDALRSILHDTMSEVEWEPYIGICRFQADLPHNTTISFYFDRHTVINGMETALIVHGVMMELHENGDTIMKHQNLTELQEWVMGCVVKNGNHNI